MQLILEFFRAEDADDPYAFRTGTQSYVLRSEGGGAQTAVLNWDAQLLSDLQAVRLPGREPACVQRLGDTLRRFLVPMGWSQYEADIAKAVQTGEPVRITVRSSAAELYALPWELLTLKATGQPIGSLPGVLFRYTWPETHTTAAEPDPRPEGGRILFCWSAAAGAVPAAAHRDAISAACARGYHPFDPERDVLSALSAGRLREALEQAAAENRPVSVLHILCHGVRSGQTFGLCWDGDEAGQGSVVVDPGQLRRLLAPHAGRVRLVIICACDGGNTGELGNHLGSVALALHQAGIQSVLASRFPFSAAGSVRFCSTLYGKLLSLPTSLEDAFTCAQKELGRDPQSLDWASVQLYARAEDGDDTRPVIFRPYRGLLAFAAQHTRFFFGRDAERQEVLADLQALARKAEPRFLIVAGASGTGKSSVVLSGVIPELLGPQQDGAADESDGEALHRVVQQLYGLWRGRAPSPAVQQALQILHSEADLGRTLGKTWQVAVLRPGTDPLGALTRALAERKDPALPFLLVVDQFEEIFTHTSDPAVRQGFASRLWSLSRGSTGVHCILTVRVDFLGQCGELVLDESGVRLDRVAYDESHRVFIAQMGPEQLLSAIENPARLVGLRLEQGLARRMIAEVGGEPGALPLLEYTLDLLWQRRRGSVLTADAYAELGGVIGALQQRANQLMESLSPEQQQQARRILVRLVSIGEGGTIDTRRHVPLASLREREPGQKSAFDAVLAAFVQARLLVQSEQSGQVMLEVAHEALIRKWEQLRKWVEEDRGMLVELQEVEQWVKQWQEYKVPLQGDQLGYAARVLEKYPADVTAAGREMIEAGQRAQKEAQAREQELARQREEQQQRELATAKRLAEEAEKLRKVQEQAAGDARAAAARQRRRTRIAGALGLFAVFTALLSLRLFHSAIDSTQEARRRVVQVYQEQGLQDLERGEALRALVYLSKAYSEIRQPGPELLEPLAQATAAADVQVASVAVSDEILQHSFGFSPDGTRLLAAGTGSKTGEGITLVFDATTGQKLRTDRSNDGAWQSAAFSADGARIVAITRGGLLKVWDALSGKQALTLDLKQKLISSIAFSPDGSQFLTALAKEKTARLWDARTGKELFSLPGHRREIRSVAYCPNGARVLTISFDRTAKLWDARTGRELLTLESKQHPIRNAVFSADCSRLITLNEDKSAQLWDAQYGGELGSLRGHQDSVYDAAFSPDGTRIVTASADKTAKVWDVPSGQVLLTLQGHRGAVLNAAISPDGSRVATLGLDGTIKIWDVRSSLQLVFKSPSKWFNDAAFSPDGTRIATAGADHSVRMWDAGTGKELFALSDHSDAVNTVAFSPDGTRLLTGSNDQTARVFELPSGKVQRKISDLLFDSHATSFSPDGSRILIVESQLHVKILDASSGKALFSVAGRTGAFSPDGTHLVTAFGSDPLRIWDMRDGHEGFTHHNQDSIGRVAFSPDETRLVVTIESDKTAKLMDAGSGEELAALQDHRGEIASAAFSADSTRVVTASADGTAKIWNAENGRALFTLKVGGEVTSAAFSPDNTRLVTTSRNGTAKLWDVGLETRSPAQIAALVRCRALFHLDREGRLQLTKVNDSAGAADDDDAPARPDLGSAAGCPLLERPLLPAHKLARARNLYAAAWAAVAAGSYQRARLDAQQALATFAEQRLAKEQADTLLLLGEAARRENNLQEAQSRRDQAHAVYQKAPEAGRQAEARALAQLADFQFNILHEPEAALAELDRARELLTDDAAVLASRAELVFASGRYDAYLAELSAALKGQEPPVRVLLVAYAWAASVLAGHRDHKQRARALLEAYRAWPEDQSLFWQFAGIREAVQRASARPADRERVLTLVRLLAEGSEEADFRTLLGLAG